MRKIASIVALLLLAGPSTALAQTASFKIIVHPSNPTAQMDKAMATRMFLKRTSTWDHGGKIRPVDQLLKAPVCKAFTESVLSRTTAAVGNYWTQRIFSGRGTPPPRMKSDAEVVAYVAKTPGAIGYVSANASTTGTKVIKFVP